MVQNNVAAESQSTAPTEGEDKQLLESASRIPLRLILEVPVIEFTVRSLLELQLGSIVETTAQHNEDLMLYANGQLVGMAKFDVTGDLLAVRMTEIA